MLDIGYTIGICQQFMPDESRREARSVVVGPLKVREFYDKEITKVFDIYGACNLSAACQNPECHYSVVARMGRAKRKEEREKQLENRAS